MLREMNWLLSKDDDDDDDDDDEHTHTQIMVAHAHARACHKRRERERKETARGNKKMSSLSPGEEKLFFAVLCMKKKSLTYCTRAV